MTGRRPVDDDQVVLAATFELLQLAQHHDVVDAGRGGGHDVDHTTAGQPFRDAAQAVVVEVLGQRGGRRQRQQLDVVAHQRPQRGLAVELDDEHSKSLVDCRTRQNSSYRGLPHTALAGHDDQPGGAEELSWIQALRRHLCAD